MILQTCEESQKEHHFRLHTFHHLKRRDHRYQVVVLFAMLGIIAYSLSLVGLPLLLLEMKTREN